MTLTVLVNKWPYKHYARQYIYGSIGLAETHIICFVCFST